jgi:hypothetical protein
MSGDGFLAPEEFPDELPDEFGDEEGFASSGRESDFGGGIDDIPEPHLQPGALAPGRAAPVLYSS